MIVQPHPYLPIHFRNAKKQNVEDMKGCSICGGTRYNRLHPTQDIKEFFLSGTSS